VGEVDDEKDGHFFPSLSRPSFNRTYFLIEIPALVASILICLCSSGVALKLIGFVCELFIWNLEAGEPFDSPNFPAMNAWRQGTAGKAKTVSCKAARRRIHEIGRSKRHLEFHSTQCLVSLFRSQRSREDEARRSILRRDNVLRSIDHAEPARHIHCIRNIWSCSPPSDVSSKSADRLKKLNSNVNTYFCLLVITNKMFDLQTRFD
jgi:hypothetical protein